MGTTKKSHCRMGNEFGLNHRYTMSQKCRATQFDSRNLFSNPWSRSPHGNEPGTLTTLRSVPKVTLFPGILNNGSFLPSSSLSETANGWTSSNQVLMEVACTGFACQLLHGRVVYHTCYKKSLEEDVAQHTTGDFLKILVPFVSSYRYEGDEVNMTLAKSEAKLLYEKISDKAYNDDDLIRILATRSKAQINATLNHYKNEYGNDINRDLKTEPKDEFLALLRATVKCLVRPEKYFEKVLRLAVNRGEPYDGTVTRVIATRAEFDLKIITNEYQRRNSFPLERAIARGIDKDYEKMLLALAGHVAA